MTNPTELKVGIVGIGAIAEKHAMAINEIPGARVVAGCCRRETKGREFANRFQCEWFSDYVALFRQAEPDVVTICTPSGAHLEPTRAAARHGIHVLCEKPLEVNLSRAKEMIESARTANILLGGIFPQRFNPVVQQLHAAAQAGRFGPLAVATACVPWWRDDAYYAPDRWQGTIALDGGGAMINQSIHAIDAMAWLAEAAGAGNVQEVFGYTAQRGHDPALIEVEDMAVAVLRFESGALGNIVASTSMWPGRPQRIHLAGRNGSAEVHEDQLVMWRFRDETDRDQAIRDEFGKKTTSGGAADPLAIDVANHRRNISDFLAAVRNKTPVSISAEEACRSLAIIRGIYESAAKGRPVKVANV
jgi:UDP-N-acetyl-2-amino-2-deoxyglucuronate dehydrogenase